MTTIKLKNGSGVPAASDLVQGEPALDLTNKRLYSEDSSGNVIEVGTNPTTLTVDTDTLVVDASNDRVGVGTTSPTSKLHVSGTSGAGSRVHIQSTGAGLSSFDGSGPGLLMTATGMSTSSKFTPAIQFGTTDTSFTTTNPKVGAAINGVASQSYSADDKGGMEIAFYTTPNDPGTGQTTTERMRIDNSGLVGIGATDPVSQLEVQGSAPVVTANSNVFSSSGDGTGFGIYRSASGRTAGYTWSIENVISSGGSSSSDYQIDHLVFKGRLSTSDSSLTEVMRINASGNIGIGTTTPDSALVVHGTAGADSRIHISSSSAGGTSFDGSGAGLLLTATNMNTTSKFTPAIQFGSKDTNFTTTNPKVGAAINAIARETFSADNDGGMALAFYTTSAEPGTGQTTTERMRISEDGSVGIGDTTPDAGLTVHNSSGAVIASSAIARQTYTSVGTLQVSTSGSGGVLIHSGSSDSGFLTFGDGAVAGRISYSHNTNDMTFMTGANTQMTLSQEGDLLVGKTVINIATVGFETNQTGRTRITRDGGSVLQLNRLSSTGKIAQFYKDGTEVGSISITSSATSYATSSDVRLKENIVDAPAGSLDDIQVRSFDWKADGSHQKHGLVAQELVEVAPEAVHQGETDDEMWSVDYSKLVPMMIKEIQDLKAEIAALKGA